MPSQPNYYTNTLINGPVTPWLARQVSFSEAGCPYRGTVACTRCEFKPPEVCDYRCQTGTKRPKDCTHRAYCKCGWDQTERLKAWGLI